MYSGIEMLEICIMNNNRLTSALWRLMLRTKYSELELVVFVILQYAIVVRITFNIEQMNGNKQVFISSYYSTLFESLSEGSFDSQKCSCTT